MTQWAVCLYHSRTQVHEQNKIRFLLVHQGLTILFILMLQKEKQNKSALEYLFLVCEGQTQS